MAELRETTGKTRVLHSELGEITGKTRVLPGGSGFWHTNEEMHIKHLWIFLHKSPLCYYRMVILSRWVSGSNVTWYNVILLKFEKCHGMCLSGYSSAVYGPRGTKLGREDGDGHGKNLAKAKFWNSNWLPWKSGNSLTGKLLVKWSWIFNGKTSATIAICLQKINKIYRTVSEIGPPSNCMATKSRLLRGSIDDVKHDVTPARDVIVTSYSLVSKSWVCSILNFSNRTVIKGDRAIFVKACQTGRMGIF